MTSKQLQALIDAETTNTLTISETVLIQDRSSINLRELNVVSSADPVFSIQGKHWMVQSGKVTATNGVLFDCINSQSGMVHNVFMSGFFKSKALFQCMNNNSCYDTHFIGGEWAKPQGMTVPHIMVATNGPFFNANSVSRCRFQTNGIPASPCILLSCTLTNNWLYGNTFSNINYEIPNAGAIHLHSCFGHSLQDIQIFDADLFGPITDHLIKLTRSSSTSLRSNQTRLHGYFRLSGTINDGIYDIFAPSTDHVSDTLDLNSVGGIQGANIKMNVSRSTLLFNRSLQSQFVIG